MEKQPPFKIDELTIADLEYLKWSSADDGRTYVMCAGTGYGNYRQILAGPLGEVLNQHEGNDIAVFDSEELRHYINHFIELKNGKKVYDFHDQQLEWSFNTFGPKSIRGPIDPLIHLIKEAQETIDAVRDGENPIEEFADIFFLLNDALWRAGFNFKNLMDAAFKKLEKNKQRTWPDWKTADPNAPVEHDRSKDEEVHQRKD